jgi:diguanylate cyclase (GGDEF)-like protein/PAS domain S-box-containing protein
MVGRRSADACPQKPFAMPSIDPPNQDAAVAALLRRVAAAAGVHMYEMEMLDGNEYVCHVWIGQALDSLLGGVPEGMDQERAWEACIHPDDRPAYEAGFPALHSGMATETEYRLVGFDGVTRWVWERCVPRPSADGRRLVDGIVTDITERHRVEQELAEAHDRLAHLAYHDHLTGLPNRAQFQQHLDVALARARRDASSVAVLFIDLDGFKQINDQHGHGAGDAVLRTTGERLSAAIREGDVVARLGGDEFLMLANLGRDDQAALDALRDRVHAHLQQPFSIDGRSMEVAGSVGIAVFPRDAETGDELIRVADMAMYRVKQRGRAA